MDGTGRGECPRHTYLFISLIVLGSAKSARNTAVRIAVDLGLFEKLAANECHVKSSVELADMTGANPRLVGMLVPNR